MKKTLITIVLATFLLGMSVQGEGREIRPVEEMQAASTLSTPNTPSYLQSIGIGRRRTFRSRRRMRRRWYRRNRGLHLRRGAYMRRSVRGRRHPRTIGLPIIPRRGGIGVRRRRGY